MTTSYVNSYCMHTKAFMSISTTLFNYFIFVTKKIIHDDSIAIVLMPTQYKIIS